ncbi:phage tail tube protein [Pseudomonas sp. RTB3]|uniref:phage tail tube protein n=1 Tax=unclassified Pseudomonas TaxID=196821 RepID=UPI002B22C85D|nr:MULTISPECIES: phage tail tube protein [unclassified Pseudomonas]MEB0008623.1 phage tail tube protein [Pseudomonas sp. RTB2]MEB0015941.1 phage tail tube protein [Pseudomonas sp. RTB3]MEB0271817.1 phage tail tube protein [Pseudomonas sp. 5B4]
MKTQGTDLYAIDPADHTLINVGCFTSLEGIDTTIAQIETTCMNSKARTYEAGLAEPGSASFGINVDTANPAHIRLHQLKKSGTTLQWAVGLSDGLDAEGNGIPPTIEATAGADGMRDFVLPTTRSWITFEGYMNSFPFTFGLNEVIKSSVGIQVSGDPELIPKVAVAP